MIDAGKLNPEDPSDLVQFGDLWYGVAGTTPEGDVLFSHECPDGTVIAYPFAVEPWVDFWTAGERLAELRGELDELNMRLDSARLRMLRRTPNELRRALDASEHRNLRDQCDAVRAQISELEDMGVTARVWLGPEKCPHGCVGGSNPDDFDDICDRCAGSGVNHG